MVEPRTIRVNSRKFDRTIRKSWTCELVERAEPLLVLRGEFDENISHPDLGEIKRGTVSYEYYWLDRWYNVFRFHDPNGSFRNYYCNINTPPTFANSVLDYVDLDIDILVWEHGVAEVVDYQDFEANAVKFGYPDAIRQRVVETVYDLIGQIEVRNFPFDHGLKALQDFGTPMHTQEESLP